MKTILILLLTFNLSAQDSWKFTDDKGEVIKEAVLSKSYAVDILYQSIEPIGELRAFECYPKPCGIHSFSGLSHLYNLEYYNKFPELKPTEEIINE